MSKNIFYIKYRKDSTEKVLPIHWPDCRVIIKYVFMNSQKMYLYPHGLNVTESKKTKHRIIIVHSGETGTFL